MPLNRFKSFLRPRLKRPYHRLRRALFEAIGDPRYSRPALNGLDEKLSKYLNYRGGFFIEAGANDGYSQSNTYYLEKFLGWTGILVEGIPELYHSCRRLRKKSAVRHCALVSGEFKAPQARMHYANLMSLVDGALKSEALQAAHIRRGLELQKLSGTHPVTVPARTLQSILDEYSPAPEIDFFSLDVEGYELEVLQGLDLRKYRPAFILVEVRFFEDVHAYLKPFYELVEQLTDSDFLYRRTPLQAT
jgi:FkbM family methyltransferase